MSIDDRSKDDSPDQTARKQRKIQDQQDQLDKEKQQKKQQAGQEGGGQNGDQAVQSGAREHPEPPLPKQHLKKPGLEQDLQLKPQFQAPHYKGSGKLDGLVA